MADISKITLPSGNTYDIKDSQARSEIATLKAIDNGVHLVGVTTTALTDNATTNPISVDGKSYTAVKGDLIFSGNKEFLFDGEKWHLLDELSTHGVLASKDKVKYDKATSASYTNTNSSKSVTLNGTSSNVAITATANANGNYTPAGTVSQPTFQGNEATVNITGTASGTVSQPSFTGTGVRLVTGNIAVPTSASFTGTEATIDVTGSASGTVSKPSFTGTKATGLTVSSTSGTATYTPAGSVAAPTISVKTAGTTDTIQPASATTVAKTVVAAAPGATAPSNNITYYSVSNETLSLYQLGYTTGASISLGTAKTFKTGDAAYQASVPSFTGTGARLVLQDYTPAGSVSQPTFSNGTIDGTATYTPAGSVGLTNSNKSTTVSPTTGTATYTPGGTVSQPTFSNGTISGSGKTTPSGTVSQPTFTGTKVQLAGSTTATGSVTLPTISLGHTTTEATLE